MKQYSVVGPLFNHDAYIIINDVVIQLDFVLLDDVYRLKSGITFKKEYFNSFIKTLAAESIEEFTEAIQECLPVSNWLEIYNQLKVSFSGKVVTGIWVSHNLFNINGEDIKVVPTKGVSSLLDTLVNPFPRNCKVIMVESLFADGLIHWVIPWLYLSQI